MMFKTHLAFAFLIGLILINSFTINYPSFLLIILTSIIADIDTNKSKIGRNLYPLNIMLKHRKLMHSLFFVFILCLLIWIFFNSLWLWVFIGYTSHIVLDGITKQGINLFYPFSKFKITGFIRTNGIFEKILFVLIIVGIFLTGIELSKRYFAF